MQPAHPKAADPDSESTRNPSKRRKLESRASETLESPSLKAPYTGIDGREQQSRREESLKALAQDAGETKWKLSTVGKISLTKQDLIIVHSTSKDVSALAGRRHFSGSQSHPLR